MSNKIIHQEELQEDFNIDDYIQEDSKRVLPIIIPVSYTHLTLPTKA